MKSDLIENVLEMITKGLGLLTVASGILFVTSMGSLSNSCKRPNLIYYYTDFMHNSAYSCLGFAIAFTALYLIKELGHKEALGFGWILERTIGEIVLAFIGAVALSIFGSFLLFVVIGSFNTALNLPLRNVPQSISVAEFCKEG